MSGKVIALISMLACVPAHAAAQPVTPPAVPANLEVPAGFEPFAIADAAGTQNYICLPSSNGFSWAFLGPQATLFTEGEQVMTHFLSPNPTESGTARATWQHSRDTSSVWAVAIESSTDPEYVEPGAIAWLLLRAVGVRYGPGGGDRLVGTSYVQRVNTAGGTAPGTGCSGKKDVGKRAMVPYTTQYVFYR